MDFNPCRHSLSAYLLLAKSIRLPTFLLFLIFPCFIVKAQPGLPPIGQWREHLPWHNAIDVVAIPKNIYAATSYSVYSVSDNVLTRYSKITGLNDVGVSAMVWDAATEQLVIGYASSNIDLLKGRTVKNISDIKRSNTPGDKTIYSIYCDDGKAYVCTGLGIVVIDLEKNEVKETWRIGNGGAGIKVNGFFKKDNLFYAASAEGLKTAPVSSTNLADYNQWQVLPGTAGLSAGEVNRVLPLGNTVVTLKNDSVFIQNGAQWQLLYHDVQWPIVNINTSENKLLVCQRTPQGDSRVTVLNQAGLIDRIIQQPGVVSFPLSATIRGNEVWIADFFGGLVKFDNSGFDHFVPNGPLGTATGEMQIHNGTLYVAAGSVNEAWNYEYNRNGIYVFAEGTWRGITSQTFPALDTIFDFITLAVNKENGSIWAGSYGGGLININGNNLQLFKQHNSTLQAAVGDPLSVRVSGLAYDQTGNLWISNYGAAQNLHVLKKDGTFRSFSVPFPRMENAIAQLLVDGANNIWAVSPKGNGVFVYNPGTDINNASNDRWRHLRSGSGNGNLPSNFVNCIAVDKNGFAWIGTSQGIGIVQCTDQVFSQSCEAILPVVQQDRFAGYLLIDEEVRTIAVDGANRKWVGTKNGVWLLSEHGDKLIYRFTEENSALLDNDIKKIAIDPNTGEVFFSTFKGICSFRSTATEATTTDEKMLVFPNPVPAGYNGTIAIRGVLPNAIVKIAEMNGRLVFETRALGGQAVWNGRNYKGEKVASGVYLVLVKDETGKQRMVTKVVLAGRR